MLIGGSLALVTMVGVGGVMVDYAWREAQEEEIDAALRAAVAASAHLFRGSLVANEDEIKDRIAGFLRGLLDNITIAKDDIVVDHDDATNRTTIRLEGDATYAFKSVWFAGDVGDPGSLKGKQVTVVFDASQYEFALALDVSASMGRRPFGWSITKLEALQDAIRTIAHTVDEVSKTNPGIVTLSLVPFSNVVIFADTAGTSQNDAKERYVRMLTGAEYSTQTSRDTVGHWVDTFHSYGTGDDMGPLVSRDLPDFLVPTDWNLYQSGTGDVSNQVSSLGTWSFEGSDFWNGCVMARWGAYWDPAARPVMWDPADPSNWPAKKTVAGWEPGSTGIANLPLHLSDVPPDASDPNTRFTAFSWPDARIHGLADSYLNAVLHKTVDSSFDLSMFGSTLSASENHWHLRARDRGGSLYCPEAPIVPLTDSLTALQAADHYNAVSGHSRTSWGGTFLHLGVVWGLRTLSPLWRNVWKTKSVSGADLPRTPCLEGGTTHGCSQFLEKAIVIVSDGENFIGPPVRGRTSGFFAQGSPITSNPGFSASQCGFYFDPYFDEYLAAMSAEDATTFAGNFEVNANGVFTSAGISAVMDGFQAVHATLSTLNPAIPAERVVIDAHRLLWENALTDMTPWQLFRGHDENSPTKGTDAIDVLVKTANSFGFTGRPVQNGHYCRPRTPFSAYGRADELVRTGDAPPVSDVAPFSVPQWDVSSPTSDLENTLKNRLDDWFRQVCELAGRRGVRIHAIYIGDDQLPREKAAIALLEECVDRGYGSSPVVDEVYATPTAKELKDALEDIFDIRRTLRFIDP